MANRKQKKVPLEQRPARPAPSREIYPPAMSGMIMGCNHATQAESLENNLFGLPKRHWNAVRKITVGMHIFLYNFTDQILIGTFRAMTPGVVSINATAWTFNLRKATSFPCQVKVGRELYCQPLQLGQFREIIQGNYFTSNQFFFELDDIQTTQLLELFAGHQL